MDKNENEIRRHLRRALRDLTPNEAEELWNTPVEKASGEEWYLDGTKQTRWKTTTIMKSFAMLAACLVLCFSFTMWRTLQTFSTVYLDVNPSISLEMNRKDRVVKTLALNEDGKAVLDGMDLKNTDIDVALNAILGSMVKNGYLGEESNVVLLSVESKNDDKATELSEQLSDDVELCLDEMVGENGVYYQTISRNGFVRSLEREYGISAGKAALLLKIVEKYPEFKVRELAGLTMNELEKLLNEHQIDVRETLGYKTNIPAATPTPTATPLPIITPTPIPTATPTAVPEPDDDDDDGDDDDFEYEDDTYEYYEENDDIIEYYEESFEDYEYDDDEDYEYDDDDFEGGDDD